MFGAVGSVIGRVFGTDKAAETLVDRTASALDKLVYTKEEQAEDEARSVTEARQMIVDWMKATSGQNLARRIIALVVTAMWVVAKTATLVLSLVPVWVRDVDIDKFRETLKIIADSSSDVTSAMMLVLGFYFAAPYMGDIAKGALKRFGKTE